MPTLWRYGTILNTGDITEDITSTNFCSHRAYIRRIKQKISELYDILESDKNNGEK